MAIRQAVFCDGRDGGTTAVMVAVMWREDGARDEGAGAHG